MSDNLSTRSRPTEFAPPERNLSDRTDIERFSDISQMAGVNNFAKFQYEIKPSISSKKSFDETINDLSIFDKSKVIQELKSYIEAEWIWDNKSISDEYRVKIDALVSTLISWLEKMIRSYFEEKKSRISIREQATLMIAKSSLW